MEWSWRGHRVVAGRRKKKVEDRLGERTGRRRVEKRELTFPRRVESTRMMLRDPRTKEAEMSIQTKSQGRIEEVNEPSLL